MKIFARKAFSLIEVNVAILVLSSGVIALISLFALGFRENRQSREDVASAAYADAVISRIVMAATATNLKWSAFNAIKSYPSDKGWSSYYGSNGRSLENCEDIAKSAFSKIMEEIENASEGGTGVSHAWPTEAKAGLNASGLVVVHEPNSARLKIAFRAGRHTHELLTQPIYYTEARFQGDPTK